jgi:hypothetical protein
MRLLQLVVVAIALALTAEVTAQGNRNVSLNWVRAPEADGCTSAKSVAQRVESYLESEHLLREEGFEFVSSRSAHVAIEAYVAAYRDGWQVTIGLSRGDVRVQGAEFVQRSRRCEDLEIQAALVISQLLDSPGFPYEPGMVDTPAAAPTTVAYVVNSTLPAAAPDPREDRPPRAAPPPPDATRARVLLGGSVDRGVFPSSGLGVWLGLAIDPPQLFPIEIGAAFTTSDEPGQFPDDRVGIAASASATFHGGRIALLACPAAWESGRFGIGACAGLSGSGVHTQLDRFRSDEGAWVSWLAVEVALRPSFELTASFGVWFEAAATFTLLDSAAYVAEVSDDADRFTLYGAPEQTVRLALGMSYVL